MSTGSGTSGRKWGRALRGLVASTRAAVHPATAGHLPDEALLSVVVPVYQVEAYLAACLESVLAVRYPHLEILVVDDGSTDGSAAIAAEFAARDPRIRIVRQDNAGLGAARNTGVREATGDLVTFVDSDDTVTPNGYAKMVRLLGETGSDFAVGSLRRQVRGRYLERHWLRRLHAEQRLAITIDDAPDMLGNIWAVTKVFRRDFLTRIGLEFPVGVRYEDQVPITRAYLEARSFDVLTESVYLWRTRVEGTSITQQKHQAEDLRDRLAAKQQVAALLDQGASERVVTQWFTKVFRLDLMPYYRASLSSPDESYWAVLTTATAWLVEHAPERTWELLELRFRVAAHLVARRDREGLQQFLSVSQLETSNFPVLDRDGVRVADLGLSMGADAEEVASANRLLRLAEVDLPSTAQLDGVTWTPAGRVELRGSAFVRHLPPDRYAVSTSLELRPPLWSDAEPVPIPARQETSTEANRFARRVYEDHSGSAFSAGFDLHPLVAASDPGRPTLWRAAVRVTADTVERSGFFVQRNDVGTARGRHAALVDDALLVDSWERRRGWGVTVHRRHAALLDAVLLDAPGPGERVRLRVHVGAGQTVERLLLGEEDVEVSVEPDEVRDDVLVLTVASGALDRLGSLRLVAGPEDYHPLALVVVGDVDWLPVGEDMALQTAGDRTLQVVPRTPHLLLSSVTFAPGAVAVVGTAYGVDRFTLRLTGDRVAGRGCDVKVEEGAFAATVPSTFTFWDGSSTTLWRDVYRLHGTIDDPGEVGGAEVTIRASSALQQDAPGQAHGWRMRVSASRVLAFRRVKDLDAGEASAYGRQVLRSTVYRSARDEPRRETVVFESFSGTGTDDGPGAICRALLGQHGHDHQLLWSVGDDALPVPDGTRRLLQGSRAWFEALGAARFVVTNGALPAWFSKAPDQVVVQTWRGQPVRRLGADVNDLRVLDEDDGVLARQAPEWDLLASPSEFATRTLTTALGFRGRAVEVGSPRNDVLLSDGAGRVRDDVRRRLGVRDEQLVVLYAPTYREYARVRGHHEKVLFLDPAEVTARRTDVVLLVRGHANTVEEPTVHGERVVDVTTYPDTAELYLAADVLVTDYSSAVFDFALTDKPIVLLAPDLEEYRHGERGLYVDLAVDPPGPLVRTTEEVLAVLDGLRGDDDFAAARARVRETYGALEDGRAAQRLLPLVFGESSR
ncbi:MAG: CDP-glycerol glycerophosphotransferase family protein [Nocardioidaceae bacterium]